MLARKERERRQRKVRWEFVSHLQHLKIDLVSSHACKLFHVQRLICPKSSISSPPLPLVSLLSAVKPVFVRHLHSLTIGLQLCLVRLRVRQV
jgi:hypothetical protein